MKTTNIEELLDEMTLEEQVSLLTAAFPAVFHCWLLQFHMRLEALKRFQGAA